MSPLVRTRVSLLPALALLAAGWLLPAERPPPPAPTIKRGFDLLVKPGHVVHIDPDDLVQITLVPAKVRLKIATVPAGARVSVDGRVEGIAPLWVSARPDRWVTLRFDVAGYGSVERRVFTDEDKDILVNFRR